MAASPKRRLLLPIPLLFVIAAALLRPATAQEPPGADRFGVIESFVSPQKADALGAAWTRVNFQWAWVQPDDPESWNPPIPDERVEAELAAGRLIAGLLIGIPDWALDEQGLPQGLWLPADDPANTWATFVHHVAERYRGRIDHWIIWNEPDIAAGEIAHTWDGDVADFAQLQRVAYLAARSANPQAVIHLAATTYWADYQVGREPYLSRLLDEILSDPEAVAHHYYFDVATAHLYFQPNQIYDLLSLFTDMMRRRGLDQPIWLVETNAPPADDPTWPVEAPFLKVTQREQAAFIPQALAAALAAGAERVAVYKLQDTEGDRQANPEPFGLVRLDGTARQAFETYRIAIRQMDGVFAAERERWNEVGQIRLEQRGQTTTVLFARLPQAQVAQVPATAENAQLVDMWGEAETITPTLGVYTVGLPAARCSQSIGDYCMIGGSTYYLVQAADTSPPEPTPTRTPPPTRTATPAPTANPTASPTPTLTPTQTPTATDTAAPSPSETVREVAEFVTSTPVVVIAPTRTSPAPASGWQPPELGLLVGASLLVALVVTAAIWLWRRSRPERESP